MGERTITITPPTIEPKAQSATPIKPLMVAAYCRVSNPSDEQAGSLEAQIQYYTRLIDLNPLWKSVGIYSEAVSGITIKQRTEFKKLITKCRQHKVDLILTKSISRFGRNTLDTIRTLRELQALDVDVHFEQEKIHLLEETSQMQIALYCALAQNESESKSHNIKWGVKRGFEQGTSGYANFACYGYRSDKELGLVIEPSEAEIVRLIFALRLQGYSLGKISSALAAKQIPSPTGKLVWSRECISKMLKNEKYTGSVMLQKTVVDDFFTGKQVKNRGQHDRWMFKNNHEAIVSQEVFEKVQKVYIW